MFFLLVQSQQRLFLFQQLGGFTAGDLPSLSSCLKMSFHTWVRCPGLTLPETIPHGTAGDIVNRLQSRSCECIPAEALS